MLCGLLKGLPAFHLYLPAFFVPALPNWAAAGLLKCDFTLKDIMSRLKISFKDAHMKEP